MSDTLRRKLRWRWALIAAVVLPSAFVAVTMAEQQSKQHADEVVHSTASPRLLLECWC